MAEETSRLRKHLALGEEIEINGDKFILKPLTIDELPLFFKIMAAMGSETDVESFLSRANEDTFEAIKEMIYITLQKSFPDESEEDIKMFGLQYMSVLFPKIIEINSAKFEDVNDRKRQQIVNKIRKLQKKNDKSN